MAVPFPCGFRHADDLGGPECVEAVDKGDANLDLGSLAVGGSGGSVFTEDFQAAHHGLDPAAGVIPRPTFPERPAVVPCGAQSVVSGEGGGAVARIYNVKPQQPKLCDNADSPSKGHLSIQSVIQSVQFRT